MRNQEGKEVDANEVQAPQTLATGRPVHDKTLLIARPERSIAISMSSTPLQEDGKTSGVVVSFRDITERRQLEEATNQQAERAQILATPARSFPATSIRS